MAWIELLGAPGVGKTTLLNYLHRLGYTTFEAAEHVYLANAAPIESAYDAIVDRHDILSRQAINMARFAITVTDFSLTTDLIYGQLRLSGEKLAQFNSRIHSIIKGLGCLPDLKIELAVSDVSILQHRIRARTLREPNREFELDYSDVYLNDIAELISNNTFGDIPRVRLEVGDQSPTQVLGCVLPAIQSMAGVI